MTYRYAILAISPGRWLQAKTQQPIGVVGLVIIIHVNVKGYICYDRNRLIQCEVTFLSVRFTCAENFSIISVLLDVLRCTSFFLQIKCTIENYTCYKKVSLVKNLNQ